MHIYIHIYMHIYIYIYIYIFIYIHNARCVKIGSKYNNVDQLEALRRVVKHSDVSLQQFTGLDKSVFCLEPY